MIVSTYDLSTSALLITFSTMSVAAPLSSVIMKT